MKKIILFISFFMLLAFCIRAQTTTLSSQSMQYDLAVLKACWENLHPGLYRYNTKDEMDKRFHSAQSYCSKPHTEKEFYILLSKIAESVKCGHTYLNPLNLNENIQNYFLPKYTIPFLFEVVEEKKIIITHNLSDNASLARGTEILAIQGISCKQIIDSLLTVSRSDGKNGLAKKLNNINITPDEIGAYTLFDIYFPLFFKSDTLLFKLDVVSNGKKQKLIVPPISFKNRKSIYEKSYGKVPEGKDSWAYKILNVNTAYMKFGTFAFWNSDFKPKPFVDSVFKDVLSKKEIKNLVIDIRYNEGGDNTGNYILSYITNKKIGCDDPDRRCYKYLNIPDSLLKYLSTWDRSFKKPKDPTKFFTNDIGLYEAKQSSEPCEYIEPQSSVFKGKVFLLVNAKNSSAGYEMARNVKTNKLGIVIGEPTGGCQQGINGGEFFFLTLPNSKIEIDLPLIYNYHANKPDSGIVPDKTIFKTQKDIRDNKDPELNYILGITEG